jgi:hypothetical protein
VGHFFSPMALINNHGCKAHKKKSVRLTTMVLSALFAVRRAGEDENLKRCSVLRIATPNRAKMGSGEDGGGEGIRTPDLDSAIVALSQLSYTPIQMRSIA